MASLGESLSDPTYLPRLSFSQAGVIIGGLHSIRPRRSLRRRQLAQSPRVRHRRPLVLNAISGMNRIRSVPLEESNTAHRHIIMFRGPDVFVAARGSLAETVSQASTCWSFHSLRNIAIATRERNQNTESLGRFGSSCCLDPTSFRCVLYTRIRWFDLVSPFGLVRTAWDGLCDEQNAVLTRLHNQNKQVLEQVPLYRSRTIIRDEPRARRQSPCNLNDWEPFTGVLSPSFLGDSDSAAKREMKLGQLSTWTRFGASSTRLEGVFHLIHPSNFHLSRCYRLIRTRMSEPWPLRERVGAQQSERCFFRPTCMLTCRWTRHPSFGDRIPSPSISMITCHENSTWS